MEVSRVIILTIFSFFFSSSLLLPLTETKHDGHHLHVGFYNKTCSHAEKIAANVVYKALRKDPGLAAGIIRLLFHDCFVSGCDASILLDSTPSGEPIEKAAPANAGTLKGLELIDEIKAEVEKKCPGVVSCADILAFAARDAVGHSGLPYQPMPSGRRDSIVSRADDVNLPSPRTQIDDIADLFTTKGMTVEDMVVLMAAHSIGTVHCRFFDYRLYNFSPNQKKDPNMELLQAFYLSSECPRPNSLTDDQKRNGAVFFDPITPFQLDNGFYLNLLERRALLQSDQAMANNPRTRNFVRQMAFNPVAWSRKFVKAIVELSRVDVLTGRQGQIRKNCRAVN